MEVEIINQPYSGEYKERIYDIQSDWNSQSWTWIKFTFEDGRPIVGQFRGAPKSVKVSKSRNEILVLTAYLTYRLNLESLDVIEAEELPEYADVEVSPKGDFIFHTYHEIIRMGRTLSDMILVESPFEMDLIAFKKWNGKELEFECSELMNWQRIEVMILNSEDWTIRTKKQQV